MTSGNQKLVGEKLFEGPVVFTGECSCQRIRFECNHEPTPGSACHCVVCQKLSSAPFQVYVEVPANSIKLIDRLKNVEDIGLPDDDVQGIIYVKRSNIARRMYCADCYTPIAMQYNHAPHEVSLAVSCIDSNGIARSEIREKLKIQRHIFVSSKAPWYEIPKDGVPQFQRFSDGFEPKIEIWKQQQQ